MSATVQSTEVNKIETLLGKIKKHNESYRLGCPEVSDQEYDAEVELLKSLDPDNDWFKHTEPVNVPTSRKVSLPIPMKSLNKVKNLPELFAWYNQFSINEEEHVIITPKFDGLSLLYNEDTLQAYSRGGADNEGQDCTKHAKMAGFKRDNNILYYSFGEFVFSCKNWEEHFAGKKSEETGEPYKSPRNTAAGLLMRDQPSELLKYVDFFRYGTDSNSLTQFKTYIDVYRYLCKTYDQPFLMAAIRPKDITEDYLLSLFKEWRKQYYIDGLVIYINDLSIWEKVGRHATTGNPLYAIAYKHPDFTESFETTVKGIAWRASKAGALKPVVNIEAVDTGDCQMENPTGYNAGWINNMEIAKGAKILVTRSGGVIPKILQTLIPATEEEQHEMWDELAFCPHCGEPTSWNSSYKELMCTNPDCPGIKLAKIIFFFTICGAENMGEETFAKLYDAGFTSIKAILNMTASDVMSIDGFGENMASIIAENANKIKAGVELPTLMQASDCFPGIGKVKAQKIIEELSEESLEDLYDDEVIIDVETNKELVKEAENETWRSFFQGYNAFKKFIKDNGLTIKEPEKITVDANGQFKGMSICFSGVRDASLEQRIVAGGGAIASGVSKNTTHLVVKDKSGTSSKISKANQLGIPIIQIDEFDDFFKV